MASITYRFNAHARGRQPAQQQLKVSAETRIGQRITPQPNGCWLYDNREVKRPNVMGHGGDKTNAYRFVYETLVGRIPAGHELHHTCETPLCCNPKHLTPMLPGDHMRHHHALRKARRAA